MAWYFYCTPVTLRSAYIDEKPESTIFIAKSICVIIIIRATSFSQKSGKKISSYRFQNSQKSHFQNCAVYPAFVYFTLKIKVYAGSDAFIARKFDFCGYFLQLCEKRLPASPVKSVSPKSEQSALS